jgi:transposase-like protein
MDDAEVDVLAYMTFPHAHRAKLHSTNPLERWNASTAKLSVAPKSSVSFPTKRLSSQLQG